MSESIKIYKYPLEITDEQRVVMPYGSQMLSVQFQGAQLCLWAAVDIEAPRKVSRLIRIIGTGNPFKDAEHCQYIDTVQQGPFVWHVFQNAFEEMPV